MTLSAEGRRVLLGAARAAIEAHLAGQAQEAPRDPSELREKRGAFVTLRHRTGGELRGCIGVVEPRMPLGVAVVDAAVSAAVRDPRFPPLRDPAELDELALDISVIGPLEPIGAEAVRVGVHGLAIRCGGRAGLLLPQVAVENDWDRGTYLAMVCHKAGLPETAWQRADATLLSFTAEVFGEDD